MPPSFLYNHDDEEENNQTKKKLFNTKTQWVLLQCTPIKILCDAAVYFSVYLLNTPTDINSILGMFNKYTENVIVSFVISGMAWHLRCRFMYSAPTCTKYMYNRYLHNGLFIKIALHV